MTSPSPLAVRSMRSGASTTTNSPGGAGTAGGRSRTMLRNVSRTMSGSGGPNEMRMPRAGGR